MVQQHEVKNLHDFKITQTWKASLLCLLIFLPSWLFCQHRQHINDADSIQVDLADFLKKIRNQPPSDTVRKKNKLYISVLPAAGYTLHTRFAVSIGANGAFFLDDPDSVKLSVVNINVTYSQKHQLMIPTQWNIWTKRNRYNLVGNCNFYRYPEFTYGLGGAQNSLDRADPIRYYYLMFRQTVLKQIYPNIYIGPGYNLDVHWHIVETGLPDLSTTDFQLYGKTTRSMSSGVTFNFLYDNRKNPINPARGYHLHFIYRNNATLLASNNNWQSVLFDLRKYFSLSDHGHHVLAFWSYTWLVIKGKPPYLELPATGWDMYSNQGRGYIQSRFRGRRLIDLESEYRFDIIRNGLFGGVVFAGVQSASEWPGNQIKFLWPSAGVGVRVKINKHSNTNIAVDYAWGKDGSRGFFVNLGEVF
jgi:hypothetical protein